HAEPILRSLALALQYYTGDNPARGDLDPDRPWKFNRTIVGQAPPAWQAGKVDGAATTDLLTMARTADPEAMAKKTVDRGHGDTGRRRDRHAAAKHPLDPLADDLQRPALRLRDQRQRRDPQACPPPGRLVRPALPRQDGQRGEARPDRAAV